MNNYMPKSFDEAVIEETHQYLTQSIKWVALLSMFLLTAIFFAVMLQKTHIITVQQLITLELPVLCASLFGLAGVIYKQPQKRSLGLVCCYILVLEAAWIIFIIGQFYLTTSYEVLSEYNALNSAETIVDILVFTFAISLFPKRRWLLISILPLMMIGLIIRLIEIPETPIFAVTKFICLLVIIISGQNVLIEWFKKAILSDIEKQQLLQQFKQMALLDGLTNLSNRRHFDDVMLKEVKAAERDSTPLSLILIDVDFFKRLNDSEGHQVGDECLKIIGELLHSIASRPRDLACRYGGEEFAIILPDTALEGAVYIADKIKLALRQVKIPHPDSDVSPYITVSQGVCQWQPGLEVGDVTRGADLLLYQAKSSGRDGYCSGKAKAHDAEQV
ncbi:sensor domain-containing diguanylate cyclase [Shewanella mesophila]|uniref:sensor domain-containing diguanylate cyclase n=1 Tax=Shewanella mesophila TaxID=2864208 RepID=UPI0021AC1119|nr:membrane-associated sensor domain-containing protein [Shewanella mesophila]